MTETLPHSDQDYRTNGHVNSNGRVQSSGAGALAGIPTDDPAAALQFCRALAQALASTPTLLVADFGVDPPADRLATSRPDLSVVIPVYNEEDNLPHLYERLIVTLDPIALSYEIVFVDDGSRDGSLAYLRALASRDRRVLIVELARNFGHQVAISAGLDHSRGQGVILMDADLQDPPEVLPEIIAKWRAGHDVVYAIREQRKESWLKRVAYAAFYRLLQRVANIEIPLDAGDFCIMDRRVVDVLSGMPERNRFVRGIRSWVGLNQVGLAYERQTRHAGRPKYTFIRLLYLALDGLVSFSYIPLRAITMLGFGVSLISIILAVFYMIQKLTIGLNPPGFATLIVALFFLSGIQLITLGVIGEYIGRIFEEVKQRPLYVVRGVIGERS
jgi:polyisoprenyl-phosphate glycosyltransferase